MTESVGQPASLRSRVDPSDMAWLRDWIALRAGVRVEDSRDGALWAVVLARMAAKGCATFCDYRRLLGNSHAETELVHLVQPFTVPETSFFRYPQQFEALHNLVIPELLAPPGKTRGVRAWSAGCATGEEAYTLAMVLRESAWRAPGSEGSVVATDLDERYLAQAQRGIYEERSLRNLPPGILATYFTPAGRGYEVSPQIRSMVSFQVLNLAADGYPSALNGLADLDLVFCRNVLIYFDPDMVVKVTERLLGCLREGGYLFLGHSESLRGRRLPVETVSFEGAWAYRKLGEMPAADAPARRPSERSQAGAPSTGARARGLSASREREPAGDRDSAKPTMKVTASPSQVPPAPISHAASPPTGMRSPVPARRQGAGAHGVIGRVAEEPVRRSAAVPVPLSEASPLLDRARQAADRADVEEAVRLCIASAETEASQTRAYLLLASLFRAQGKHRDAIAVLRQALFLDRGAPELHCRIGDAYRAIGEPAKALRAFRNALSYLRQRPPDAVVTDTDGITYGALREMCQAAVETLESEGRQAHERHNTQ